MQKITNQKSETRVGRTRHLGLASRHLCFRSQRTKRGEKREERNTKNKQRNKQLDVKEEKARETEGTIGG